jgi:ubiquinone/menaquinone biosynthesis C-methylase UbiE
LYEQAAPEEARLDISRSFVSIARDNAEREGVAVDFRHGDATCGFPDQSFDFLLCRAAFKNCSSDRIVSRRDRRAEAELP